MPIRISAPNGSLQLITNNMNVTDGSEVAGSTVHTVGFWMNRSNDFVTSSAFAPLINFGRALQFSTSNTNFRVFLASLTGGVGNGSISFLPPANTWTFVTYRTQSGLQELFIDGSGVGSATATYTSLSTSSVSNTIRGPAYTVPSVSGGSISLNGWFQINKRLTDQEIIDIYNGDLKPQDFSEFNFVVPMNLSSPSSISLLDEDLQNIGNASYQFTSIASEVNAERISGNQHNWAESSTPVLRFTTTDNIAISNPIETIETTVSGDPLVRSLFLWSDDAAFNTNNTFSAGSIGRLSISETLDASGNNFVFGSGTIPADSYIRFNFDLDRSTVTEGYELPGILIENSGANDVSGYYSMLVEPADTFSNLKVRYNETNLNSGDTIIVEDLFINEIISEPISVINEGSSSVSFGATGWLFSGQIIPLNDLIPLSLAPSGSADASFRFDTSLERSVTGYLTFSSNDPESPFVQTFVSRVLSPTIIVEGFPNEDNYDFENVTFNSIESATFEIFNTGPTGLIISPATHGHISLGQHSSLIQPNQTGFIDVMLSTSVLGNTSGYLDINSNDPKNLLIRINTQANVIQGDSYYNRFGTVINESESSNLLESDNKIKSSVIKEGNIFITSNPTNNLNYKINELLLNEKNLNLQNGDFNIREVVRSDYEIVEGSGDTSTNDRITYFYKTSTDINQKEL